MNQTVIILSAIFGLLFVVLVVVLLKKEKFTEPVVVDNLMYANLKSRTNPRGIRGNLPIM